MNIESGKQYYEHSLKGFKIGQFKFPLRLMFQKRAFQAVCLGTPKSGTHSIANMLNLDLRSLHEPDEIFMINLIHKKAKGLISNDEIVKTLKRRDKCNWLEMESSHYLGAFVEELVAVNYETKFILTIRDCISWMDSWFNHQLSRPTLKND